MARRKGSKNRTTLERELAAAGVAGDLSKLSYDELASKAVATVAPEPPKAAVPEPTEQTIIDPADARAVIEDTRRRFAIMVDYYTIAEDVSAPSETSFIPERIQEFLRSRVFMAPSVEAARAVGREALNKLHTHMLSLWANGRISGPSTIQNVAKRAAKAEKWAVRLEKLGRVEDAKRQREKVEAIRRSVTASKTPWSH